MVTGDFCPRNKTEELIVAGKYSLVFDDMVNEFNGNDLNIVNLECPLTNSVHALSKTGPNLKALPDCVNALKYINIHVAALSNNHIMDYGEEGILDTIKKCKEVAISTVGAGSSLIDAQQPFVIKIKNKTIAVLNFSENELSSAYGSSPGANPLNLIDNHQAITEARKHADIVLVLYHGGNEYYDLPSPRVKKTCRFFVDAGADVVIMHHTHIISGYELYKDVPIFYGLGNFNFEWEGRKDDPWNYGYSVRLLFKDGLTTFDLVPHKQSNGNAGTYLLDKSEKKQFYSNINDLNSVIQDDQQLEDRFDTFCIRKSRIYDMYLQPYSGKLLSSLRYKGLLPNLFASRKKMLLLNLIQCESHRDLFVHMLRM